MAPDFTDYAVAVIVETPNGIPLVCDPQKPSPLFWKFPGGRNRPGETPEETAVRELREETLIGLSKDKLNLVHEETRKTQDGEHLFFLFRADVRENVNFSKRGETGEEVRFVRKEDIKNLAEFFPNHKVLAEKFLFKNSENGK